MRCICVTYFNLGGVVWLEVVQLVLSLIIHLRLESKKRVTLFDSRFSKLTMVMGRSYNYNLLLLSSLSQSK